MPLHVRARKGRDCVRHCRLNSAQVVATTILRPGALDAEHRGVGPTKTSAQTRAVAGVRAALGTAPTADRDAAGQNDVIG
jgi:hypothetical protein